MNKHIMNVLSKYNFTYEKNYGYGYIDGFEVNVVDIAGDTGPMFLFSTFLNQTQKNEFVLRVNNLKIKMVNANYFEYGVMVKIGAMTGKSFEPKFEETMPKVIDILNEFGAPKADICPQSGLSLETVENRVVNINGFKIKLASSAIESINSSIKKENEEHELAPNNYLKGLFGIVIGAIAGVILTVILWYLGFVTTFAPLLSILLGTYLYKKFGSKRNWMMIVMSFVTTLVFILGAFVLVYALSAQIAAAENGYTFTLFGALKYILDNSDEFRRIFYYDLALNGFFILLAEGFSVYKLIQEIKRPKQV